MDVAASPEDKFNRGFNLGRADRLKPYLLVAFIQTALQIFDK